MDLNVYFGDLHNHCAVGLFHYAKGSLERAIEIAQEHLDFFAFTGHSQWHDMPAMPDDRQTLWQEGFDYHARQWPKTKRLIREANETSGFVALLGYEWHSAACGDHNILFKDDDGDLIFTDRLEELQRYARQQGALLIPHHIGYKSGLPGRGINWSVLDETVSPVIEIYSEHGGAERDRGPWPYIRHSNGPRTTRNTLQWGLAQGHRVGVIAGTDDHLGFPGAYGEGLAGVWARQLSREAILQALRERRCYAVTGDRIELDFRINDAPMGSILPASSDREIRVTVRGWDEIDRIEVLRNNRVIYRHFPEADDPPQETQPAVYLCRIEYGWGPWTALGMPRTADWDIALAIQDGRIQRHQPCWQSGPFDEKRRHRIRTLTGDRCEWQSYTGREGAFAETPTNAIVFELAGPPEATVSLTFRRPAEKQFRWRLAELAESSAVEFMGGFPSESFLVHRLVPEGLFRAALAFTDKPSRQPQEDFYYVRVTQSNGHMAWSSPIWVGNPS